MCNRKCQLAAALLILSSSCYAQRVALSVTELDCGPAGPGLRVPSSREESERVTAKWLSPDELQVEAWDDETVNSRIDPRSARVSVHESTITLDYAFKSIELEHDGPHLSCLLPVRLTFTVSGIPHDRYELHLPRGGRRATIEK